MSTTPVSRPASRPATRSAAQAPRRVRHQARDVVAVMSFSAATSLAIVVLLLLVGGLAGTGR